MRLKTLCATAFMALSMVTTASAQSNEEKVVSYPQIFIGARVVATRRFRIYTTGRWILRTRGWG